MKVKLPKPAPDNQRVREIQQWLGAHGGSVANAYVVNAAPLRELGAERGVIEKILWRVPREKPELPLTAEAMMEILAPKRLMREVRKQLKLDSQEHQTHAKAFEQSRRQLIGSRISAERKTGKPSFARWNPGSSWCCRRCATPKPFFARRNCFGGRPRHSSSIAPFARHDRAG